jgi:hypothetical protein
MEKIAIAVLLLSSPAMADVITITGPPPAPGGASNPPSAPGAVIDPPCYPIGKTDDGHFVYSMDCKNVPVTLPAGAAQETYDRGSGQSGNTPPNGSR